MSEHVIQNPPPPRKVIKRVASSWARHLTCLISSQGKTAFKYTTSVGAIFRSPVWWKGLNIQESLKDRFSLLQKTKKTKRLLYLKGKYTQSHTSFPNFSFAVIIHCCEFALANVWFIWNRIIAKWVSLSDLQISRGFHLVCNCMLLTTCAVC